MLTDIETTDCEFPVWSGRLALLQLIAPKGFPDDYLISRPAAKIKQGIAKIALSGVVTRTSWHEFAAEIGRLSSKRNVKGIAVSFDTEIQQAEGSREALDAVARCVKRGQKPIHAHITKAIGMAYAVAVTCDKVYTANGAEFGRGDIDIPYVKKLIAENPPSEKDN